MSSYVKRTCNLSELMNVPIILVLCSVQVVVNALVQAIPAIFNVLLVCLVFWLIFSIMGVNLFGGRFSSCLDDNGDYVNFSIVSSKNECDALGPIYNYTWYTPKVNFDNCLIAYLALFQVVSNSRFACEIRRTIIDLRFGMMQLIKFRTALRCFYETGLVSTLAISARNSSVNTHERLIAWCWYIMPSDYYEHLTQKIKSFNFYNL
jgi:Ion transport protein